MRQNWKLSWMVIWRINSCRKDPVRMSQTKTITLSLTLPPSKLKRLCGRVRSPVALFSDRCDPCWKNESQQNIFQHCFIISKILILRTFKMIRSLLKFRDLSPDNRLVLLTRAWLWKLLFYLCRMIGQARFICHTQTNTRSTMQ